MLGKRLMTFVIYTIDGQHLTVDCDKLNRSEDSLDLYNRKNADNEDSVLDWIASFEHRNIVGWEQIR